MSLSAQPDWSRLVPEAFAALDREAADSIAARRANCEPLRLEMEKLVDELGWEREMIFGPSGEYLDEGMSKKMTGVPKPMGIAMKRDERVERLEALHVRLYHQDAALMRWLEIASRLENHKDRVQHRRWAIGYGELSPEEARALDDPDQCRYWIQTLVLCDLMTEIEATSPDRGIGQVKDFNLKFEYSELRDADKNPEPSQWSLPLPPEAIVYSFPVNGQYAFRHDENKRGVGYVVLPVWVSDKVRSLMEEDRAWRARWTSAAGKVRYSAMNTHFSGSQFYFNLPTDFFEEGELYRLEIVGLPQEGVKHQPPGELCWQWFRGNRENIQPQAFQLPGEVRITELYFRAGKYDVFEQAKIMEGTADWETGSILFETDEPFLLPDIRGSGYMEPWARFRLNTGRFYSFWEALQEKELFYYLTVPQVEPLESLPLDELAVAELDNTFQAFFVEDVRKGNPKSYVTVPDRLMADWELPGGYTAPAHYCPPGADSLICPVETPFITKKLFEEKQRPEPGTMQCRLSVGEFRNLVAAVALHKEQIVRRIEERARFFYELERRAALREGRELSLSLEDFRARELENLPASAKLILDTDFPEGIRGKLTITYLRFFPGSQQGTTILEIKLNEN